MKKILFTLLFLVTFLAGYSQMSNNGGTITVENGATLVIEGDYTSSGAASIEIDGAVQLKGDFVNNGGNISSGSVGTLTFNGTLAQEIGGTTPTNFYCAVVVNNAAGVSLTGADAVLYNALTLTNGKLSLNAYDLTMAAVGITVTTGNYVVTNGAGQLMANVAATDVTFPVGDATTYNPVILNNTTGTADTYGVIFTGTMPSGWTGTDHAVTGNWAITEGTAGGSLLTVTPAWAGTQEQTSFDNTDCAVGVSADEGATVTWAEFGAAAGTDPYARIGTGFTSVGKFLVGDSFWNAIVLNLDFILAGPYDAVTGKMSTALNLIIPANDPYGNGQTIGTIPATVVDWIEVELRDQADNTSVLYSESFLIDEDGNVLDVDGSAGATFSGVPKTNYYIAVLHRNHFGVVSANPVNLSVALPTYDFTTAQTQAWQDGTNTTNAAMKEVETGVFGLWEGDANDDGVVNYIGGSSDRASIVAQLGITSLGSTLAGYFDNDVNMNGIVAYLGGTSDRSVIVNNLGVTALGTYISRHLPLP